MAYIGAFLLTVVALFLLWRLIKAMMGPFNFYFSMADFEGRIGTVYNNIGDGRYVVSVKTNDGTQYPTCVYEPEDKTLEDSLLDGTHVYLGKMKQDGSYPIIKK